MELGCEDAFRLTTVREEGRERSLPPPPPAFSAMPPGAGSPSLKSHKAKNQLF